VIKGLLVFSWIFGLSSLAHAGETWKLASFEWAPYLCDKACPGEGGGGKALRLALKSMDIDVEYTYFPWSRAIRETPAGHFDGFQPAWPEDCPKDFFFSEKLYSSPLGLIDNNSKPVQVKKLEDLRHYVVAVVQDYGNTRRFNELVKDGTIKTQMVAVEHLVLGMVSKSRVNIAVMDLGNLRYYLETTHKQYKDVLQANPFSQVSGARRLTIRYS